MAYPSSSSSMFQPPPAGGHQTQRSAGGPPPRHKCIYSHSISSGDKIITSYFVLCYILGSYPAIVVSQTLHEMSPLTIPIWVAVYATQLSRNDFVVLLFLCVPVSQKKITWCTLFPRDILHRSAPPSIRVSTAACTLILCNR